MTYLIPLYIFKMATYSLLSLLVVLCLVVFVVGVDKDLGCKWPRMIRKQHYFFKLARSKADLKEKNDIEYKQIMLYRATNIIGWQISGKSGTLKGEQLWKRRGAITEYVIQYIGSDGKWKFITNPKTKTKVFTTIANEADPTKVTIVKLPQSVNAFAVRIFPQLWDGIPYLNINLIGCNAPVYYKTMPPPSKVTRPPKKEKKTIKKSKILKNVDAFIEAGDEREDKKKANTQAQQPKSRRRPAPGTGETPSKSPTVKPNAAAPIKGKNVSKQKKPSMDFDIFDF